MTDNKEWRPKVGERVIVIRGVFKNRLGQIVEDNNSSLPFQVMFDRDFTGRWFHLKELSPIPIPVTIERKPWDIIREAVPFLVKMGWDGDELLADADMMEADAAPKPLTLRETVRAYIDAKGNHARQDAWDQMLSALTKEESNNV